MTAAIAAIVVILLSALIVGWTKHLKVLDIPNERSSHVNPTARGGGIAIAGITIIGTALTAPRMWPFLTAAAVIAILGWIDDVKNINAGLRFAVQLAAASAVVFVYSPIQRIAGITFPLWFAIPITVIWIVALTNAYNFMDGIDGIAGSQAVIAGAAWCAIASGTVSTIALLIAAASVGFLIHNWPPASIFMGDVGSAFLCFSFAVFPLIDRRPVTPVVAFIVISPFLFDSAYTLICRVIKRERVWKAHRSHLYQRLVIAGWSHRGVTLLYAGVAIANAATALLISRGIRGAYALAALTLVASAAMLLTLTFRAERAP